MSQRRVYTSRLSGKTYGDYDAVIFAEPEVREYSQFMPVLESKYGIGTAAIPYTVSVVGNPDYERPIV